MGRVPVPAAVLAVQVNALGRAVVVPGPKPWAVPVAVAVPGPKPWAVKVSDADWGGLAPVIDSKGVDTPPYVISRVCAERGPTGLQLQKL